MDSINRPGATLRLFAYAGDFSLGQLIFHGLISVGHVRALYEGMRGWIKIDGVLGDSLTSLLAVYIITALIRFYSTIVLGVSPFQWLVGIKTGARGFGGRFSSAARVALEIVFIPLVIPQLPVVFSYPSLCEVMSGARLEKGEGVRGVLGFLARPLVLIFIFLSFFAPLLRNLAVIEGVQVDFAQIPPAKVDSSVDFSKFKFFPSNFFGFTTFGNLDGERFILIPQFEVTKESNHTRIRPFLGIYDSRNHALGFLKKESDIDWRKLVRIARAGNPFFNSSYPFLAGELEQEQQSDFSSQALVELETLVVASLELSFQNVIAHVSRHGPFLSGYVDLRQALLSLLDTGAKARADSVNLGDRRFLRFRQLFDEVPSIEKKYREILIPLGSARAPMLRYEWDASMEAAVTRRDFASAFLAQAQWGKKSDGLPSPEDTSSLVVIDYLLDDSLTLEQKSELQKFTQQWFKQNAKRSLKEKDVVLQTWLSLTLNRFYLVLQGRNDYEKLSKNLLLMRHALEAKDIFYFGLKE